MLKLKIDAAALVIDREALQGHGTNTLTKNIDVCELELLD
jgi:hypothetical protein